MEIERINTQASKLAIFAWFAGLAYYNWFSSTPISVPLWGHIVLVVAGMFFASIVIGGGLALISAAVTKMLTGRTDGSPHIFAWAAFIGTIPAFLAAKQGLMLLQ
jgi:hypothetical protein